MRDGLVQIRGHLERLVVEGECFVLLAIAVQFLALFHEIKRCWRGSLLGAACPVSRKTTTCGALADLRGRSYSTRSGGGKRWRGANGFLAFYVCAGNSQPSSFILLLVQCCNCSKSAGSITAKRSPTRPSPPNHTMRALARNMFSLWGDGSFHIEKTSKFHRFFQARRFPIRQYSDLRPGRELRRRAGFSIKTASWMRARKNFCCSRLMNPKAFALSPGLTLMLYSFSFRLSVRREIPSCSAAWPR